MDRGPEDQHAREPRRSPRSSRIRRNPSATRRGRRSGATRRRGIAGRAGPSLNSSAQTFRIGRNTYTVPAMRAPSEGPPADTNGPAVIACDHCGGLIGVYEPLIIAERGKVRESSRAAESSLPLVETTYYHRACYQAI